MEAFLKYYQLFLVVWVRLLAMAMVTVPFSSAVMPVRMRATFAFFLALLIYPVISSNEAAVQLSRYTTSEYFLILLKEILIGLVIGFMVTLFFSAFQLAASFFSLQMGLSFASVVDPTNNEENSLLGYMFYSFTLLVFFGIGGMGMLLNALVDSFRIISIFDYGYNSQGFVEMGVKYFSNMFVLGLKIAMPVIMTTGLIMLIIGFLGKISPQSNLMILGLPLQWTIGIISVMIVFPYMVNVFGNTFESVVSGTLTYMKDIMNEVKP